MLQRMSRVSLTRAWSARRHGSGGGGLAPKPNFAGTAEWPDGYYTGAFLNKTNRFYQKGTDPNGIPDLCGFDGALGKYLAFSAPCCDRMQRAEDQPLRPRRRLEPSRCALSHGRPNCCHVAVLGVNFMQKVADMTSKKDDDGHGHH